MTNASHMDHPHAPIVLITFANLAFVIVDAAAQKPEISGVYSRQIMTMRMALRNPDDESTVSCPGVDGTRLSVLAHPNQARPCRDHVRPSY